MQIYVNNLYTAPRPPRGGGTRKLEENNTSTPTPNLNPALARFREIEDPKFKPGGAIKGKCPQDVS